MSIGLIFLSFPSLPTHIDIGGCSSHILLKNVLSSLKVCQCEYNDGGGPWSVTLAQSSTQCSVKLLTIIFD